MAKLLTLTKNIGKMSFVEGLAFVERTRRQLDRFELLPHPEGQRISPENTAKIRGMCDELEADIHRLLSEP